MKTPFPQARFYGGKSVALHCFEAAFALLKRRTAHLKNIDEHPKKFVGAIANLRAAPYYVHAKNFH